MKVATKIQRHLERKKSRLESRIASAGKLINEMPPAVKAELRRIVKTLREGKVEFDRLTVTEFRLLNALDEAIRDMAEAEYELAEIQSALRPGRAKGIRNKQPKALDTTIAAALSEWETYFLSNPEKSERAIAQKLAFKHCLVKTKDARGVFAERLRSARRRSKKSKKWRYRKMAKAME
jgi:hypothetical protein